MKMYRVIEVYKGPDGIEEDVIESERPVSISKALNLCNYLNLTYANSETHYKVEEIEEIKV